MQSPEGYVIGLMARSARTVLVEGRHDKWLVDRIVSELDGAGRLGSQPIVVDSTELVRCPTGARCAVEEVHALVHRLNRPFAALVDREFRDFTLAPDVVDDVACHKVVNGTLFWTRGHSAENYFFTSAVVMGFLQLKFPHCVNQALLVRIESAFEGVLNWAAALSVAALQEELISRLDGAIASDDWVLAASGTVALSYDAVAHRLTSRGVDGERFKKFCATADRIKVALDAVPGNSIARWLAHGHIGSQVIWTSVGRLVADGGAAIDDVRQVATGFQDLKRRFAIDHWVRNHVPATWQGALSEAPEGLISWCMS